MEPNNILSIFWKNKEHFCVIDEELIAENTFIEQTSKGENLWKAQLGMTMNFIIFLRCDSHFFSQDNSNYKFLPEQTNILINMIPKSQLKVRKHSKRTLKVVFPFGNVCYFKLPIYDGCGKAWTRWKIIEQACSSDTLSIVPISILIPFSKLNQNLQKIIIADQFVKCFSSFSKHFLKSADSIQITSNISNELKSHQTEDKDRKLDSNMQPSEDVTKIIKQKGKLDIKECLNADTEISQTSISEIKSRKSRQIRRFGEGIPENCIFDLTLSYSDALVEDNNTTVDKNDDELYNNISLDERASKMFSRSFTDSSETEKEKFLNTQPSDKNKKLYSNIFFEERALKVFGKSFRDSSEIKYKESKNK